MMVLCAVAIHPYTGRASLFPFSRARTSIDTSRILLCHISRIPLYRRGRFTGAAEV